MGERYSRFNLLDEPWISVLVDEAGTTRDVSLLDLFKNAHLYKELAGDMRTQDFAVLRVLLAVLHTVFSRVDANGYCYEYFELDNSFLPSNSVDEDEVDDYKDDLMDTWEELWKKGRFPACVADYLEAWRDRFYLYDTDYPFFQVRKEDINQDKHSANGKGVGVVWGKEFNRQISESANKAALFSPNCEVDSNKERLFDADVARWLITYQSYTGQGGKVKYKTVSEGSAGWLYSLGGIYYKGNNLFDTLMLNCILPYEPYGNLLTSQKPCWEYSSKEILDLYLNKKVVTNLTALYTVWSRAIFIDSQFVSNSKFYAYPEKLPKVEREDMFLEPMTLWRFNKSGESKNKFTPKKHVIDQSLWRSFGLLAKVNFSDVNNGVGQHLPGIINWMQDIKGVVKEKINEPIICAVSMKDDGNATSWSPVDEILDILAINEFVLTDVVETGWVNRINDVVQQTSHVIEKIYGSYLNGVKAIRYGDGKSDFVSIRKEEVYAGIDQPFRNWLGLISYNDDKDEKMIEWRKILKELVKTAAKELTYAGNTRDYKGKKNENKEQVENIATLYNQFLWRLNKELDVKEGDAV